MHFRPSFHDSMYVCSMSSTVASVGRLTVFDIEPEMNGWTPAIIRTWPIGAIDRAPLTGLNAQSKTFRCSSGEVRRALDRVVLVDVLDDLLDLVAVVAELAQRRPARCR